MLLAALLLLASQVWAKPETLRTQRIRIHTDSDKAAAFWKRVARLCADNVDSLLGISAAPRQTVTLRIDDSDLSQGGRLRLAFPPGTPLEQVTHCLSRALVLRHAMDLYPDAETPAESLDWLAAAANYQLLFCGRNPSGQPDPDYEAARYLFRQGRFPAIATLLERPIAPDCGAAYQLYALHCHLLAATVESDAHTSPGRLRRTLELQAHGRPSADAIEFVARESFRPEEDLQDWYERQASRTGRKGRRPASLAETSRRLESLETVPMATLGAADSSHKRMPIDAIPKGLKTKQLDRAAVKRLERDFYELMKDAPGLLQDPLLEYVKSLQLLEKARGSSFRRRLRRARKAYAKAAKRQQTVEAYLDQLELEALPLTQRLSLYLECMRGNEARRRSLDPALHSYLDSLSP